MTSKRFGILLFILALAWSVAGLGWFTPWAGTESESVFLVGAALADPPVGDHPATTYTPSGDPDAFANAPSSGDPDAFTEPPSPSDSTSTSVGTPGAPTSRVSPVLRVVLAVGSAISGILGWS